VPDTATVRLNRHRSIGTGEQRHSFPLDFEYAYAEIRDAVFGDAAAVLVLRALLPGFGMTGAMSDHEVPRCAAQNVCEGHLTAGALVVLRHVP
jgi:hypothetical protein